LLGIGQLAFSFVSDAFSFDWTMWKTEWIVAAVCGRSVGDKAERFPERETLYGELLVRSIVSG